MSNSFSMLFSDGGDADNMSVDCTLSLATPSTRAARPSPFGWNILPPPAGRSNAGDPLLSRRCANCGTASTPLWRNGPRGPKSLCNACGIRFKKEERRAAAVGHVEAQHGSWAQAQKAACYASAYGNEFRFGEGDGAGRDSEFMAWRFNVADRPGLVHDFTR